MENELNQYKIPYVAVDDTRKIIELKIRTSAVGEYPIKFESFYMAVAKEIPEDIVKEMIDKEIERLHNSMENWKNWREYRERIAYGK